MRLNWKDLLLELFLGCVISRLSVLELINVVFFQHVNGFDTRKIMLLRANVELASFILSLFFL